MLKEKLVFRGVPFLFIALSNRTISWSYHSFQSSRDYVSVAIEMLTPEELMITVWTSIKFRTPDSYTSKLLQYGG